VKISIIEDNKKTSKIKIWTVFFWLIIWQGVSMVIDKEILLVSPISTIRELLKLVKELSFWHSIQFSFGKISVGFLFAFFIGILLAIGSSQYIHLEELLAPLMLTIKSIPVASFIILCLIWLNAKSLSTFISFLMVLPIIYTNTLEGILNMDKNLYEMVTVFKVSPLKRIRYVYLSQVMPYVIAASKVALGLCWKAGIAAEIIGVPKNSIGEHLYLAKLYLSMRELFAWTLVIIFISVVFEKLVLYLLKIAMYRLENR